MEEENKFAKAAIKVILENPGEKYNPLYFYGECEKAKEIIANTAVKMTHIKANEIDEADIEAKILLIDDLESIQDNKEQQEKWINFFNQQLALKKQMIFLASKHPQELQLNERLQSRLTWGLVVEIN